MRLDAVKAEADRKARKQTELGLPSFPEYDPTQPLTGDAEYETSTTSTRVPYRDAQYAAARQPTGSSGRTQQTGYVHSQQTSGYAPSNYSGPTAISTGPPAPYLNADNTGYQASTGTDTNNTPAMLLRDAVRNTMETLMTMDDPRPQHTMYRMHVLHLTALAQTPSGHILPHKHSPRLTRIMPRRASPAAVHTSTTIQPPMPEPASPYYTPQAQTAAQSLSYAVGGGGYGDSTAPALPDPRASANSGGYLPYPGEVMTPSSGSVYTGLESPPAGRLPSPEPYEDSPPMYDEGPGIGHTTGPSHTTAAPRPRKR
ncbi:hypothetical protein BJV77DRAFT_1074692 [Russula vinacea]|nr:hypothetical protein BJV77DRAFT_1074692 [Russula vinacea]